MARLITFAGLPGVGKSSIARALARRTGAMWLRIDSMDRAIWASGTAPKDLQDWSYRAAQAVAADNLALGVDVIADWHIAVSSNASKKRSVSSVSHAVDPWAGRTSHDGSRRSKATPSR